MALLGALDGGWVYEAMLPAGDTPRTLWYRFEAQADDQRACYGNAQDGLGGVGQQDGEASYQVTVYDAAFTPPRWLCDGVMYQIMVDRFFNGDPTGALLRAKEDVARHADWYEPPALKIAPNGDNLADDFFGGNLAGIRQKLPYLRGLGVTALYLNPIFESASNHKYDTGDYNRIDPMFGDEEDFAALCRDAQALGMRVMLDGVFAHVGADSRYFNRAGRYPDAGAYQSQASPYYPWFTFTHYPDAYACWWGFDTLPRVRVMEPSYQRFALNGPDAVVPRWLRAGACGWRLDVADELPMPFLRNLRRSAKAENADAALLGEVWEDATNKVTYGEARNYALGDTLDSVMNYPLYDVLMNFLLGWEDASRAKRRLDALAENYPRPFLYSLMNLLGSHDRARILNVLAGYTGENVPRPERAAMRLTDEQAALGAARVRLMLRLVCALPGMPCVYYGDEAGMQGAPDPFCRGTYPWGREDERQVAFFADQLNRRRGLPVLARGDLTLLAPARDALVILRRISGGVDALGDPAEDALALAAVNRGDTPLKLCLLAAQVGCEALIGEDGARLYARDGAFSVVLPPLEGALLVGA
jgi:4-alpha-glucanotransferase